MIRDLSSPKPAENLAAQVPFESDALSSGFYLALVLDVLTVAFALWAGLLYRGFLGGGNSLAGTIIVAVLFATFLAIGLYLTKKTARRVLVLAGAVAGLFLFFFLSGNVAHAGAGAALTFLLLLWGEALGRARVANSIGLSFFHGVQPLLAKASTALVLSGLILFVPYWTPARAFLSSSDFDSYFRVVGGTLHRFYEEIDFSNSFDEFALSLAHYELLGNQEFKSLPVPRQAEVVKEVTAKVKESMGRTLQVGPEEGGKTMGAIFYRLLTRTLGDMQARFGGWFLAGWVAVLFVMLRGIAVFFYWLAGLFGLIIFHSLIALGAVRIRGETRTQEVVEYI